MSPIAEEFYCCEVEENGIVRKPKIVDEMDKNDWFKSAFLENRTASFMKSAEGLNMCTAAKSHRFI